MNDRNITSGSAPLIARVRWPRLTPGLFEQILQLARESGSCSFLLPSVEKFIEQHSANSTKDLNYASFSIGAQLRSICIKTEINTPELPFPAEHLVGRSAGAYAYLFAGYSGISYDKASEVVNDLLREVQANTISDAETIFGLSAEGVRTQKFASGATLLAGLYTGRNQQTTSVKRKIKDTNKTHKLAKRLLKANQKLNDWKLHGPTPVKTYNLDDNVMITQVFLPYRASRQSVLKVESGKEVSIEELVHRKVEQIHSRK